MIGHSKVGVSMDTEGLPVLSGVCLQALVAEELELLGAPLINDGVLHTILLPILSPASATANRVSHHQEVLQERSKANTS